MRARLRMAMSQIEHDWLSLVKTIESGPPAQARTARKQLSDQLAASGRLFPARGWFLGLEFGIADCAWAALLWRLASLKLALPSGSEPIRRYAERVFARPAFAASLVESQRTAASKGHR
jgi:RNA polymerase-associated protein